MTPQPGTMGIGAAQQALRAATRDLHSQLDAALAVGRAGAGRAEYINYLRALRGWLAPWEAELWDAPWPAELLAAERSCKLQWIDADLHAAGLDAAAIAAIARCDFRPDFASMAQRYGVAYVIEGAQLGTQVLRKRLALGDWSPRWLQGYGADTGARWLAFLGCMERALADDRSRAAAAGAARQAFATLAVWFRQHGAA